METPAGCAMAGSAEERSERLLPAATSYEEACRQFRWRIPAHYNIASDVCDRHAANADAVALIQETVGGPRSWTFREIQRIANQLANTMTACGMARQSRVAVLLGQDVEAAITHVAAWKAAMISVSMSRLFGPDALLHRLADSGAQMLVTDRDGFAAVAAVRERLPELRTVLLIDGDGPGALDFWRTLSRASDGFQTLRTNASEPAFINYTSGTTGAPKGVVKAHHAMLGQMPAIEFCHDFFPRPGDLFWSPADWSWLAGLMNVLFPAWFHGKPVLAYRARQFDPEEALALMARHRVRNTLLTPTMLKLMRQVPGVLGRSDVQLRSIVSGSEVVGAELSAWAREAFDVDVHVVFGQTECNSVIGNNGRLMKIKPGSLGRPMPGHEVAIVDAAGQVLPRGERGNIAFRRPDPKMMLGYWNQPDATKEKFVGDWMLTGDLGLCDDEGYFWFHAREDDVISSSGYRIGPGEIEDTLLKHPAVAMAAVVGVPDTKRGQAIKAFIVPSQCTQATEDLRQEIRDYVKARLAKHEAPHEIEFVHSLPLTSNGKILRRELREQEIRRQETGAQGARPDPT